MTVKKFTFYRHRTWPNVLVITTLDTVKKQDASLTGTYWRVAWPLLSPDPATGNPQQSMMAADDIERFWFPAKD